MLSLERVRELLEDRTLSDEEAEEIRDSLRLLAEVIFEKWSAQRKAARDNLPQGKQAP